MALEQLDPAKHSGAPMSYREFCLMSEKFKVLCELSRKQQSPSPQRQHSINSSRAKSLESKSVNTCSGTAAFAEGFQNPLFAQDPHLEGGLQACMPPNYSSQSFEDRSSASAAANSASRLQGPGFHLQDRERAGLSCPSSPVPPAFSPGPMSSRVSGSHEAKKAVASFRRALSSDAFGDSAKEDREKGERRRSAASHRQSMQQERSGSRGSVHSAHTGVGSSSGWKF